MKQTYILTGMTCQGCVASVTEQLSKVDGITQVAIDLEQGAAALTMQHKVPLSQLEAVLSSKYTITAKEHHSTETSKATKTSKWVQLRPLFLIFTYLFVAAFLLNYPNWSTKAAMLDFMGLFYIVFSFFKLLDFKGFPKSFSMYDPLAKAVPVYGWVYPFLELGLGLLFLMRIQLQWALIATMVVLGITTFGVIRTLLNKKSIRCACLGTALNLPMTEATFIENTIMLVMALWMLL